MIARISEFASTGSQPQPDHSVVLSNNDSIIIIDKQQKVLKPGESYLITISKIASNNIIIEEASDEQNEEDQTPRIEP